MQSDTQAAACGAAGRGACARGSTAARGLVGATDEDEGDGLDYGLDMHVVGALDGHERYRQDACHRVYLFQAQGFGRRVWA